MQTRKIKKIEYPLFKDEKEFRHYMPNKYLARDWRDSEEGDWVLTDDKQVCMVIKKGVLSTGRKKQIKQDYIRTVIGSFLCKPSVKIEGEMRKNIYSFGSADKTPRERQQSRKKATNKEFLFAKYVAKGDDIVDSFIKAFPTNNKEYAKKEAGMLLKTDRVKSLVREEIDKLMKRLILNLDTKGYFWPQDKEKSLKLYLHNLFSKLPLNSSDIRFLHGLIRALSEERKK